MSQPAAGERNRRICIRRPPKGTTKVTCLKGTMGLGANLALALLDLSETGARLQVRAALERGKEVEISLLAPGQGRPIKFIADVVWCVPAEDGTFRLGVNFRRRLIYQELQQLVVQRS